MPTNIVVPELGESILEATVGRWLKNEGDPVTVGEPVVALETEKVDLEVGAERSGVLAKIERQAGQDVRIGEVLGVIDDSTSQRNVVPAQGDAAGLNAVPKGGPTNGSGPAPSSAFEARTTSANKPAPAQAVAPSTPPAGATAGPAEAVTERDLSPSARRFARERGASATAVPEDAGGSGAQKRAPGSISPKASASYPEAPPELRPGPPPPRPMPLAGVDQTQSPSQILGQPDRREERVRMSRRRQTIARRLVEAQHAAAMLTTFNEVDMSAVMDLRKRQKDAFKQKYGIGLGISSFFVKAVVSALREFPRLNAEIEEDEIILKHYYDIGIAVGAAGGLVVPVLRDADRLSFAEIERLIKDYAQKAQDGTLTLDDLRGGTFTITNGGVFGSLLSTPILNPPQVGILGLHKIQERPVSVNGQIVSRPMMYVALSYDHRLVDGLEAVQFLVRVKQLVEEPGVLLLES
jgi:2-oxoglutarate dehydrogenase E2 component (dihydrolipoamide succinyltransferase)